MRIREALVDEQMPDPCEEEDVFLCLVLKLWDTEQLVEDFGVAPLKDIGVDGLRPEKDGLPCQVVHELGCDAQPSIVVRRVGQSLADFSASVDLGVKVLDESTHMVRVPKGRQSVS
jgi:hypothetical protein